MISATEQCPQPQTREHLQALEIVGVDKLIVVQNKIDLVSQEQAQKNYEDIKTFLKGSKFEKAPIIPMSAIHSINLDVLLQAIEDNFKTPKRVVDADPMMFIARSFDINKPGSRPGNITGGILGGALKQGKLKEGQEIEIRPGYEVEEQNKKVWKPLRSTILSVMTGGEKVKEVGPGGSIAVMTLLDPSVVKSDKLVGAVVGLPGKLPPVWYDFSLETHLLARVVGAKDKLVVDPIKKGEILMLNINAAATVGVVKDIGKNKISFTLKRPVSAEIEARVSMSRRVGQRWRLIGYGIIQE